MEKVILFDENTTSLDKWRKRDGSPAEWTIKDGILHVGIGTDDIVSTEKYGDAHVHVEWCEPDTPEATGQDKGNSGVYVHGSYEVQVLDSYGAEEPALDDCGAIYKMYKPIVNASKAPLEWQTYDIYIRAPRFDENGKRVLNASMTVFQNGKLIHNNIDLYRVTPGSITEEPPAEGPLILQDHDCPVSFRNVWFERL